MQKHKIIIAMLLPNISGLLNIYNLTFVLLIFTETYSFGQRLQVYDFSYLHPLLTNPSTAGIGTGIEANMSVNKQWAGITDAPFTSIFSIHSKTQHLGMKSHRRTHGKVALGLSLFSDHNGPVWHNSMQIVYGYHLPINKLQMSFGLSAHLSQFGVKQHELKPYYVNDPLLTSGVSKLWQADAGFGLSFSGKTFAIGISMLELMRSPTNISANSNMFSYQNSRDYAFYANYLYKYNTLWTLQPTIQIRSAENTSIYTETAIRIYYNNHWVSINYTLHEYWRFYIAVAVKRIVLGYSFAYNITPITQYSAGTHQVFIRFNEP